MGHGHGGTVGEPIYTFAMQFRPIFICKRNIFRRTFASQSKYINSVYQSIPMNENVRNDISIIGNCLQRWLVIPDTC